MGVQSAAVIVFLIIWNASQTIVPDGAQAPEGASRPEVEATRRPPTTVTRSFDGEFLDHLPIHGHAYQDALSLAPGVSDHDDDGRITIHGARESQVAFRLDGGEVTDPLTGSSGLNLNPYVIENIDVITAGAPASMGRALGGFVEVTSRSGGNDLDGKVGLFWRDAFLDGDSGENDDLFSTAVPQGSFEDFRALARMGGPFVKDRLWWFAALERIEGESPAQPEDPEALIGFRGLYSFGKVTWQASPESRLTLQGAADPRSVEGLGLSPSTDPDSGYAVDQGTLSLRLGWSQVLSEQAMLDVSFAHYDQSVEVDPESSDFTPTRVPVQVPDSLGEGAVASYPCAAPNCSTTLGDDPLYRYTASNGRTSGPYYARQDQDRRRDAMAAEVSAFLSPAHGTHHLSGGFELGQEEVENEVFLNPILYDYTSRLITPGPDPNVERVFGFQLLQVFLPEAGTSRATTANGAIWISDSFKPMPNLSIVAGVRLDAEQLDFPGREPFDPVDERARSITLWKAVCDEAVRQGTVSFSSVCYPLKPYNGSPPDVSFSTFYDEDGDGINDVAPEVAALDLDGDGFFFHFGQDAEALFQHFTRYEDRAFGGFTIHETNVSPRVGLSWDPSRAGRMKLFAHWGRYFDRLDPEAGLVESQPDAMSFVFVPGINNQILPGSVSRPAGVPSIQQIDHDLGAPRMDELSLGAEFALGPAWRAGLTFVNRRADNLLQDGDRNHYTCTQAGIVGIDPAAVCGDPNGVLNLDRFGMPNAGPGPAGMPNGLVDLYAASPLYGTVLAVENADGAETTAWEVSAVRSMHHDWQMKAGYTFSRSRGVASETFDFARDDVSVPANGREWLDSDERHSLELQAVWRLPATVVLGGMLRWDSGLPYTVYGQPEADLDSGGTSVFRLLLPTGEGNDQRNEGRWRLDARLEKGFRIGKVNAAAFVSAQNLLDDDSLVVTSYTDGGYVTAVRDLGRRFEIGGTVAF